MMLVVYRRRSCHDAQQRPGGQHMDSIQPSGRRTFKHTICHHLIPSCNPYHHIPSRTLVSSRAVSITQVRAVIEPTASSISRMPRGENALACWCAKFGGCTVTLPRVEFSIENENDDWWWWCWFIPLESEGREPPSHEARVAQKLITSGDKQYLQGCQVFEIHVALPIHTIQTP